MCKPSVPVVKWCSQLSHQLNVQNQLAWLFYQPTNELMKIPTYSLSLMLAPAQLGILPLLEDPQAPSNTGDFQ